MNLSMLIAIELGFDSRFSTDDHTFYCRRWFTILLSLSLSLYFDFQQRTSAYWTQRTNRLRLSHESSDFYWPLRSIEIEIAATENKKKRETLKPIGGNHSACGFLLLTFFCFFFVSFVCLFCFFLHREWEKKTGEQ